MQSSSFVFREGLEWADIDWVDNGECLDLIEKVSTTILMKRVSLIPSPSNTYLVSFVTVIMVLTQRLTPGAA